MTDRFGRKIEYLRVSITDRCNLRCIYCMPSMPDGFCPVSHDDVLRYEEIERVVRCMVPLGIRHVRVTGGEPLARKGAAGFAGRLRKIPGIETVTMTTNGVLLSEYARELAEAGIDGVNISLDTTDEALSERITNRPGTVKAVKEAIRRMREYGVPVKINAVLLKETLPSICGLLEFAKDGIPVRFIELMPIGYGKELEGATPEEARAVIRESYPDFAESGVRLGAGPARYYSSSRLAAPVGFIEAVSHSFCSSCNRVRLTSTGLLKSCLCFDQGTDLSGMLRGSASDDDIKEAVRNCIYLKPAKHCFDSKEDITETKLMSQIGG
ncbi:MAG: GTP 3',8-cyclase MoaA [Clostridia bacterium]|nr:GTP 3',8-cyclase MoaA [Clostridia bacterium]